MQETLQTFKYGFHVIFHPFDGFWELKHHKKNTSSAALIWLFLVSLVTIAKIQFSSFVFGTVVKEETNILLNALINVVIVGAWTIMNWALSTLADGKATISQIWVATIYAQIPIVLLQIPIILLTHVLTAEEGVFIMLLYNIAQLWFYALVLIGNMTIQDYTMTKTVIMALLTFAGIIAAVFLLSVLMSVLMQLYRFFATIYAEIMFSF